MVENNWLGDKTRDRRFFKKTKSAAGEKEILDPNCKHWNMAQDKSQNLQTLETAKPIEDLKTRIKALCAGTDKPGNLPPVHLIYCLHQSPHSRH